MVNNIKNEFSIKDLENLSGIKAHTIRIWEKRYGVLVPMRTESNIRTYGTADLQKLLNITLLHNYGYKISKVSKMSDTEMTAMIRNITSTKTSQNSAVNSLKVAMMHFNQQLFAQTYELLTSHKTFQEIFQEIFIPMLDEIGLLWQTNTITPAHEHFISHQIRMRVILNTLQAEEKVTINNDKVYVLFLPLNEIHELGLLYLNYELAMNNCQTIYLGENIPKENLIDISRRFNNVTYMCYVTVAQDAEEITNYLTYIDAEVLRKFNSKMLVFGKGSQNIMKSQLSENIKFIDSIKNLSIFL